MPSHTFPKTQPAYLMSWFPFLGFLPIIVNTQPHCGRNNNHTFNARYVCTYLVTQLCMTFWNHMDCSPPHSVQGTLQARILEWVDISSCRGSSWPRDQTLISCIGRQILLPLSHLESLDTVFYYLNLNNHAPCNHHHPISQMGKL